MPSFYKMSLKIDQDLELFNRKIRSLKREAIKKYFRHDEFGIVNKNGKELKVPIRVLEIPRFAFNLEDTGGVGMGSGEEGDSIPGPYGQDISQQGIDNGGDEDGEDTEEPGGREAIERYIPSRHRYVGVSREEIAEGLEEYLHLPNLTELFGNDIIGKPNVKYWSG